MVRKDMSLLRVMILRAVGAMATAATSSTGRSVGITGLFFMV